MEDKMKSYKLTDEEKVIENEIENLKPISGKKKEEIETIIEQAKKTDQLV